MRDTQESHHTHVQLKWDAIWSKTDLIGLREAILATVPGDPTQQADHEALFDQLEVYMTLFPLSKSNKRIIHYYFYLHRSIYYRVRGLSA